MVRGDMGAIWQSMWESGIGCSSPCTSQLVPPSSPRAPTTDMLTAVGVVDIEATAARDGARKKSNVRLAGSPKPEAGAKPTETRAVTAQIRARGGAARGMSGDAKWQGACYCER